jgi:hypothetical protein
VVPSGGLSAVALLLALLGAPASEAAGQAGGSTLLFTLPEYDLDPENIAFDSVSGDFFLGSMGQSRILQIHEDGSYENFVTGLERYLFFTLDRTIRRLDLERGDLTPIRTPEGADVGTDGLYFHDGALIVMKPRLSQILRLLLNPSLDGVEKVEVLAQGDPGWAYPTTGVVVGDRLVFVATSFADTPRSTESARQHPEVRIHEVPLGRSGDMSYCATV